MWVELLQAAQPVVQEAVTTAAQHGDLAEKTVTQIPLAIAIVKGIELVKASNVPGTRWLRKNSSRRLLQWVNVGAAFLATMGITGMFQYADSGDFSITVAGNITDFGSKFFSFFSQWGMQEVVYNIHQGSKASSSTKEMVTDHYTAEQIAAALGRSKELRKVLRPGG